MDQPLKLRPACGRLCRHVYKNPLLPGQPDLRKPAHYRILHLVGQEAKGLAKSQKTDSNSFTFLTCSYEYMSFPGGSKICQLAAHAWFYPILCIIFCQQHGCCPGSG